MIFFAAQLARSISAALIASSSCFLGGADTHKALVHESSLLEGNPLSTKVYFCLIN